MRRHLSLALARLWGPSRRRRRLPGAAEEAVATARSGEGAAESRLEKVRDDHAAALKKLRGDHDAQRARVEADLNAAETLKNTLAEELRASLAGHKKTTMTLEQHVLDNAEDVGRIENLESLLASSDAALKSTSSDLAAAREQISVGDAALRVAENRLRANSEDLERGAAEVARLAREVGEREDRVSRLERAGRDAADAIAAASARETEHNARAADAAAAIKDGTKKLRRASQLHADTAAELERRASQVVSLEVATAEAAAGAQGAEARAVSAEHDARTTHRELKETQQALKAADGELRALQKDTAARDARGRENDAFKVALSGVLAGLALDRDSGTVSADELLGAGADPEVVRAIDHGGTGNIDVRTFVDVLSQAVNYQGPDQSNAMLRDYTAVAVTVLEQRYEAKLDAAKKKHPWNMLVCSE